MSTSKFVLAIRSADEPVVKRMIRDGFSVKKRIRFQADDVAECWLTPLGIAVYNDNPSIVTQLINSGANVNSKETLKFKHSQQTLCLYGLACRYQKSNSQQVLSLILNAGAHVDVPMFLSHSEDEEEGGSLVFKNPESQGSLIETPLIWCIHTNKLESVETILKCGADPLYVYTNKSHDPLNTDGYLSTALSIVSLDCVKILLQSGGVIPEHESLHLLDFLVTSLCQTLSEKDCSEIVSLLLETDVNLSQCYPIIQWYTRFANSTTNTLQEQEETRNFTNHAEQLVRQYKNILLDKSGARSIPINMQNTTFSVHSAILDFTEIPISSDVFQRFYDTFSRPRLLTQLCRQQIRLILGRIKLVSKISLLPVSNSIKKFLLYNF